MIDRKKQGQSAPSFQPRMTYAKTGAQTHSWWMKRRAFLCWITWEPSSNIFKGLFCNNLIMLYHSKIKKSSTQVCTILLSWKWKSHTHTSERERKYLSLYISSTGRTYRSCNECQCQTLISESITGEVGSDMVQITWWNNGLRHTHEQEKE